MPSAWSQLLDTIVICWKQSNGPDIASAQHLVRDKVFLTNEAARSSLGANDERDQLFRHEMRSQIGISDQISGQLQKLRVTVVRA